MAPGGMLAPGLSAGRHRALCLSRLPVCRDRLKAELIQVNISAWRG